jgi:Tfp pilus assembly protein PilX
MIMIGSNERGIAMVLSLFMVMVVSVLATSLMFVSQTETLSSRNYRTSSQARYAAESGVHRAVNHLLYTYVPPSAAADLANYDMTVSPVTFGGNPVVLSSDPDVTANYPVAADQNAFNAAAQGVLDVTNGTVNYNASATLLSMRQIIDAFSGAPMTLQTWRVSGEGNVTGLDATQVQVEAIIERQVSPVFTYAAFATAKGCGALSFAGGAETDSFDSTQPLVGGVPELADHGGNVGTNGNLTGSGNTTSLGGSLSTPRSGVGACTSNNVTAASLNGATVDDGLVSLSQSIDYPTPPTPVPLAGSTGFGKTSGCPANISGGCTVSANGATLTPALAGGTITMGNVDVGSQAELHLNAGTYVINSFNMNANSKIIIDSGPVIFQVAGDATSPTDVISITGNGISNTSYDPNNLQFIYGGTKNIKLAGGSETAALLYAPNATASFSGGADFYGAVIVGQLTATGGTSIHYDRNLANTVVHRGESDDELLHVAKLLAPGSG